MRGRAGGTKLPPLVGFADDGGRDGLCGAAPPPALRAGVLPRIAKRTTSLREVAGERRFSWNASTPPRGASAIAPSSVSASKAEQPAPVDHPHVASGGAEFDDAADA